MAIQRLGPHIFTGSAEELVGMITGEMSKAKATEEWQKALKPGDYIYRMWDFNEGSNPPDYHMLFQQVLAPGSVEDREVLERRPELLFVMGYSTSCPLGEEGTTFRANAHGVLTKEEFEHAYRNQWQDLIVCVGCFKRPHMMAEYVGIAKEEDLTPDEYVRREVGTYNVRTHHFLCTSCYVAWGMPGAPGSGWKAP